MDKEDMLTHLVDVARVGLSMRGVAPAQDTGDGLWSHQGFMTGFRWYDRNVSIRGTYGREYGFQRCFLENQQYLFDRLRQHVHSTIDGVGPALFAEFECALLKVGVKLERDEYRGIAYCTSVNDPDIAFLSGDERHVETKTIQLRPDLRIETNADRVVRMVANCRDIPKHLLRPEYQHLPDLATHVVPDELYPSVEMPDLASALRKTIEIYAQAPLFT